MDKALACLTRLRVGHSKGRPAPNKPCLLLAILCEIQAGHITSPRVAIDDRLVARYHDLYELAAGVRREARPWLPLWFLASDRGPDGEAGSLWQPALSPALAEVADQLGAPGSLDQLLKRFDTASLHPELYARLASEEATREAGAHLVARYFSWSPDAQARLHDYLEDAFASGAYEKAPERLKGPEGDSPRQARARSAAFRSLVLEAYDYRCAASRLRYITPDYRYLVEAAHLVPFAESQDDRPVNGIALTPNLHWAMDNLLIAPGPDQRWHVSPSVDALVPDSRWLCELDRQPLVLPRDPRWQPDRDALAWRLDQLRR
ncbi:HNH endonuclease [Halomonas shengliensis]|uniref:HNH endonuclease n=1 Tax=Halomonas shengliensis TaxID=419597 RepID=A0A1H0JM28_9GAMM|nr:HNH endonuclease [Halomonas shengliensis]SDO44622.1 HNH endonuclease [Halomonas shengliensis]